MERRPELDSLRGIAILLVLLHHFTLGSGGARTAMHLGWIGVDLFFVLSGFLITSILLEAKGGRGYFRRFYARRTLRIFPLYYAFLAAVFLLVPHLPLNAAHAAKAASVEGREWTYWLYLGNFEIAGADRFPHAVLGVTWTLAVEEQFYVVWPLVVALLSRRALAGFCAVLFLAAPLCRLAVADGSYLPAYVLPFCRMDALAAGAWLAATRGRVARPLLRAAPFAAGIAVLSLCLLEGVSARHRGWHTWGFSATAILFLGVVANARRTWRPLETLGRYSYAMYLLHMPCRLVVTRVFRPESAAGQLWFYALAGGLTFGTAWLSWHLLEKRFLALKRFVPMPAGDRHDGSRSPDSRDGPDGGGGAGPSESRRGAGSLQPLVGSSSASACHE